MRRERMTFDFDYSDRLETELAALKKRNPVLVAAVFKKIKQITQNNDLEAIDHFKNLKAPLNDLKRVHVLGSFVLKFRVYKEQNFILFDRLDHHDDAY